MSDMAPLTCWWSGMPGIDGRCLSGDLTFDDRMASIWIATRLHGALPLERDRTGPARAADRTAESLFQLFQEAKTDQEALRLRLAIAAVVGTMTPGEKHELRAVEQRAKALAALMTRPGRKRATRAGKLAPTG
jgi:hypothetical protein